MKLIIWELLERLNIKNEMEDFDAIHQAIDKDIVFKGTNMWVLIFAIVVASVGLNMNSTAVIIGAMLISPLMGPINGMGYSIATYNFPLFRKSFKNFSFAVIASLFASTAYFFISPISTAHSELLARTSPTIYDVLIALFGGLAGIVAITSRQKGNVIPGVAIATALMPPLCTAGYGLATLQFPYFFGALYLFTINTVFIAISSVVVSQLLKFPIRTLVDKAQRNKVNNIISVVITLVIIPSIYFGYKLVQKERFIDNANKYLSNVSVIEGNYLLKHEVNANKHSITLIYGGATLTEAQKERIKAKASDFELNSATIDFKQGLSFDEITKKNTEVENLKGEINRLTLVLKDQESFVDSIKHQSVKGKDLLMEIKPIFPSITSCSYAQTKVFNDSLDKQVHLVVITATRNFENSEKEKIKNWLHIRLKTKSVKVYFERRGD
jgi:uncharacterized hydrophobic protein (TIGR00271 family)